MNLRMTIIEENGAIQLPENNDTSQDMHLVFVDDGIVYWTKVFSIIKCLFSTPKDSQLR